jgi:nitroreductase
MNAVLNAIKNRRSVRKYKLDQIDQKNLETILEAGIYAPTACNEQPWYFTIIQNEEMLKHINIKAKEAMKESPIEWIKNMGLNPEFQVTYNAPTLIIVSGKKDSTAYKVDCSAAIQNMLIAAESLEIGSVWLGLMRFYFEHEGSTRELQIPDGYKPFYGVVFGYKADEKKIAAPKRNLDVVNYIR